MANLRIYGAAVQAGGTGDEAMEADRLHHKEERARGAVEEAVRFHLGVG